mmetsp:Transcript_34307/g.48738  ORF Transcript_34307/g.48738 Transcript_34307/m.48738 type:complete len:96 (-) Transcript_34307:58-345(-)
MKQSRKFWFLGIVDETPYELTVPSISKKILKKLKLCFSELYLLPSIIMQQPISYFIGLLTTHQLYSTYECCTLLDYRLFLVLVLPGIIVDCSIKN